METKSGVSVIIATRNRANYLEQCLSSIAAQKCNSPFEIVVIDNCSTDNTPAIIRRWCDKDRRFRTAREDRLGLSQAKNAGVQLAKGELLLFTDDDVIVDVNWIETYCDFFSRKSQDMVVAGGPIIPIPRDLGNWPSWFAEPALADVGLLDYRAERVLTKWEWIWGANMAIPAGLFDQMGLWDVTVGRRGDARGTFEDTEFQDRLRNGGGSVWFCPSAVIHHRVDRHTISPRQILSTAYARGRNDVFLKNIPLWHDVTRIPKRNAVECLVNLVGNMFRWGLWVILFRLLRWKICFERAREAAFASGRSLDILRAGRNSLRLFQAAARIAFPARSILLRLTPDIS